MDGERFDAIAQQLATGRTRRGALRLLGGGALGGLLGLRGAGEAAADHGCRHAGRVCTRDRQCCSGDCLPNGSCRCTASRQCPRPTESCKRAVCTVTGRCVIGDKANGTACEDGGACQDGKCLIGPVGPPGPTG